MVRLVGKSFCNSSVTVQRFATGPHWYLRALRVEPARQGERAGGRLMQTVIERVDSEGVDCCLETQNEAKVAF
ncbi:MAG: GNAT family N-acetyltransferase [Acidobacteriota bacterium]